MILSEEPEARRPSGRTSKSLYPNFSSFYLAAFLARFEIPELYHSINRTRGKPTIDQARKRQYWSMAVEPHTFLAGIEIPDADCLVI